MARYTYDHIHLRSRDPMEAARYLNRIFDAKINESIQSDGQPRVDVDLDGLVIFIAEADDSTPASLRDPHLGLDHFGFRVDNIDEVVADLKAGGRSFPGSRPPSGPASASRLCAPLTTSVSSCYSGIKFDVFRWAGGACRSIVALAASRQPGEDSDYDDCHARHQHDPAQSLNQESAYRRDQNQPQQSEQGAAPDCRSRAGSSEP